MNAIPGGSIGFSVIVIGQQNNATTGIVSISSDGGIRSNHDISSALCTNLSHEITVEDSSNNSVMVNVTLSGTRPLIKFCPSHLSYIFSTI